MASRSGSFDTGGYDGRYLHFEWGIVSQSTNSNRTHIWWTLKGAGGRTDDWYVSGPIRLWINGSQVVAQEGRINLMNGTVVGSGNDFIINHDSSGKASFSANAEGAIWTYALNVWGSGSWTLPDIPRKATITSAPDFNDTDNPKVEYSNKAGSSVSSLKIGIYSTDGNTAYAAYRDISKTGSSYTFELTDTERNALRNATPNSNTMKVRFYIQTVIGSTTFVDYAEKTLTIVDGNPTFTATYEDSNATTVAITSDNQKIIQGQSTLQINVSSLSAKKGASISTVVATINGTNYSGTVSGTSSTISVGTLNVSSNLNGTVKVTDTRGNVTEQALTITVLGWELPSAIVTMERENNYYTPTTITVDGSISSVGGFNTMTIQMRYKKTTESTWSSYVTMQDNVGQTFQMDNDYYWDVQVKITDLFGNTTYNLTLSRGMPIIYFDRYLSSVGVNCLPKDHRSLEVNGVPVNRNIMTARLTSDVTSLTANTPTKVTLGSATSTGDRLTSYSGGIKIGAGITKVLVSAQMQVEVPNNAGFCYAIIVKNNDASTGTMAWSKEVIQAGGEHAIRIEPVLLTVAENDVLNIFYQVPDSSDNIKGDSNDLTWMTVDVAG